MIFDIFSELQCAKPWRENHERALLLEAIEQARLADRLGYGCWWTVERVAKKIESETSRCEKA